MWQSKYTQVTPFDMSSVAWSSMVMTFEEHAGVTCFWIVHLLLSHMTLKRVDRQTKKTDAVTKPTKLLTHPNTNKMNNHKTNSQQNKQLNKHLNNLAANKTIKQLNNKPISPQNGQPVELLTK